MLNKHCLYFGRPGKLMHGLGKVMPGKARQRLFFTPGDMHFCHVLLLSGAALHPCFMLLMV